MKTILVTGAAGFIGSYLVRRLLYSYEGLTVVGLDNLNSYYDVSLKEYRLRQIVKTAEEHPNNAWRFEKRRFGRQGVCRAPFLRTPVRCGGEFGSSGWCALFHQKPPMPTSHLTLSVFTISLNRVAIASTMARKA